MRFLLASTGIGTLAALLATPASAETTITTAVTNPVLTGTAGDDIRITSTGSVKPTGGAAVTINSNDSVKNEGAIAIKGANGATGILANTNLAGDITNSGTITIDEDFTATDADTDGDLDGPFAQGTDRFGIHVLGGGTFTGNIVNGGTITIEGNQSAGIAVDSALTGSLTSTGKISVLGDNSVGIRAGAVSGNVVVGSGSATGVQGKDAVGVLLGGDIGGALVIQGTVTTTGYRSTAAPADTSKLDADDLLQGGSAVVVGGNVAGGILLDSKPADNSTTDTDEDDDGIPDANETTAAVTSFGAAPALAIGSATQDIAIGAVASSGAGHGIVIKGSVSGLGIYSGVACHGAVDRRHRPCGERRRRDDHLRHRRRQLAQFERHRNPHRRRRQRVADRRRGNRFRQGRRHGWFGRAGHRHRRRGDRQRDRQQRNIAATRAGDTGTAAAIVDHSGTLALVQNNGQIGVSNAADTRRQCDRDRPARQRPRARPCGRSPPPAARPLR